MKIATYNVNGVNGRLAGAAALARAGQPDVVCLQELKAPEEKFPEKAIRELGYGAVWHGQKSWNGVAILAAGRDPRDAARPARRPRRHATAATSRRRSAGS